MSNSVRRHIETGLQILSGIIDGLIILYVIFISPSFFIRGILYVKILMEYILTKWLCRFTGRHQQLLNSAVPLIIVLTIGTLLFRNIYCFIVDLIVILLTVIEWKHSFFSRKV